ncbi:Aspartic peptidase domain superfamily [Sesbania bispinosa]|nr:Aspartic peptidase domain superfamily [Sesbania bispinosa]
MAENTRIKELTADVKRILELMETREKEYSTRFELLELAIDALVHKRSVGESGLTVHTPPFQASDNEEPEPDPPDHICQSECHRIQEHHLSYNALSSSSRLGTMQFQGYMHGMLVQVLLYGGSSDNFLQPRLAHCLKLPIEPVPNTNVVAGNGHTLVVEGLIPDLEVKIQGHSIKLLVYLLPVAGAGLVLGASWLATLGPYISNYNTLTIKFYVGDHFITWYGD